MTRASTIEARMTSSRLPGKCAAGRRQAAAGADGRAPAPCAPPRRDRHRDHRGRRLRSAPGAGRAARDRLFPWQRGRRSARVLGAAQAYDADLIVELTGDCPLIDPRSSTTPDRAPPRGRRDYTANVLDETFPLGFAVQVFSTRVLAEVAAHRRSRRPRARLALHLRAPRALPAAQHRHDQPAELRLTVDTAEDYELVMTVFEELRPGDSASRDPRPVRPQARAAVDQPARRAEKGPMRAAVLGCGMIGAGTGEPHPDVGVMTHAGAYAAHPDTELVAVCDPDPARAAAAPRAGGARLHRRARAAGRAVPRSSASPRPTPRTPSSSRPVCARRRGRCWPRSRSRSTPGRRALVHSARTGAALAVNYTRRFAPAFQRSPARARRDPACQRRLREGPQAQRHALARPAAPARRRADGGARLGPPR